MSTARDLLDEMTHHALVTAVWTGYWHCDIDGARRECATDLGNCPGHALDERYDVEDVSPEARTEIRARLLHFCTEHVEDVIAYLNTTDRPERDEYSRASLLAHDYVLTANGHGAGFWDRGLGDLGDRLTDAAHADGGWELYVGDDGRLYA